MFCAMGQPTQRAQNEAAVNVSERFELVFTSQNGFFIRISLSMPL